MYQVCWAKNWVDQKIFHTALVLGSGPSITEALLYVRFFCELPNHYTKCVGKVAAERVTKKNSV